MIEARGGPPTGTPATERPMIRRVINPHRVFPKRTVDLEGTHSAFHWTKGPLISPSRMWKATRDVFKDVPGYAYMHKAISKHIDLRRKYKGHYTAQALKTYKAIPRRMRKQATEDFRHYWTTNQTQGKAAANALTLSPHARSLVDVSKAIFDELGDINQQKNVHVFDPKIGMFRPIGKVGQSGKVDYFPRIIQGAHHGHAPQRGPQPGGMGGAEGGPDRGGEDQRGQRRSGDDELRQRHDGDLQGQRVLRVARHGPVTGAAEQGLRLLLRRGLALRRELERAHGADRGVRTEARQAGQGPVGPCLRAGR